MSADRIRPGSAGGGEAGDEKLDGTDVPSTPKADENPPIATSGTEGAPALPDGLQDPVTAEVGERPDGSIDTGDRAEAANEEELAAAIAVAPLAHRGFATRLYYGETRFDFVRRRRIWFAISSLVILAGVLSLATRGLNLGIEFVGGTSWTVNVPAKTSLTTSDVQNAIGTRLNGETVTFLGNTLTHSLTLEVDAKLTKQQTNASILNEETLVSGVLSRLTHQSASNVSVESVGPSWGGEITHKAIVALIVFFILIALYISLFFEWRMAFAAIVAVIHDILVTVGIYSLTGLEVTPDTVVAFLTILGYSLYDTIVVFDRVRDNVKNLSLRDRMTYSDVVNASMNQTLARSINTSLVAIMPILAVLVLGAEILGATTLQYFGLALLVGLTTGAYSSIFIASPLVAMIKEREQRYRVIRERLESRGTATLLLSPAAMARGALAGNFEGTGTPGRKRAAQPVQGRLRPSAASSVQGGGAGVNPVGSGEFGSGTPASDRPRPTPKPRPGRPGPSRPAARTRRKGRRR